VAGQHQALGEERWQRFSLDQQILMIGNEMSRGRSLMKPADWHLLAGCYERALRLTDLTVRVNPRRSLRRELLRWRDLAAELYIAGAPDPAGHDTVFRGLLQLTPAAFEQIPYVFE
jgi:hypothetical protein